MEDEHVGENLILYILTWITWIHKSISFCVEKERNLLYIQRVSSTKERSTPNTNRRNARDE